jgi:hypothetical protein
MARTVAELFTVQTAVEFLAEGLALAQSVGLLVTSWRTGDPTRASFQFLARGLGNSEERRAEFAKAGFLSSAEDDWKTVVAEEVYGIDRVEATPATSIVTLLNTGGGFYDEDVGSVVFKSTLSGKTYRNTEAVSLHGVGATQSVDVVADEAGSGSSAGLNEIDALVTSLLGVSVTGSSVAVGVDAQDDTALEAQCNASLGALSPNGPPDAYEYVARNPALTGVADITRARSDPNSGTLAVTIYVASASGPVAGASVTAAQDAIEAWATPLCVTPTVLNSSAHTVNITATATGSNIPLDAQDRIEAALAELLAAQPIGISTGYDIDPTTITTTIRNTVPEITGLPAYSPAVAVHIAAGEVPVLGTCVISF